MVGPTLPPTGLPEGLTPLHVRQTSRNAMFAADDSVEGREEAEAGVSQKMAKRCGYILEVQRELTVYGSSECSGPSVANGLRRVRRRISCSTSSALPRSEHVSLVRRCW